jgi:hypothetical protein
MYSYGTIFYRDAFGTRHYTKYCVNFPVAALNVPNTVFEYCQKHNDAN